MFHLPNSKKVGQFGGGVFKPFGQIAKNFRVPLTQSQPVQQTPQAPPHSFLERAKGGRVMSNALGRTTVY